MGRNVKYRHLPCGYCGRVTHRNEGEHVVPKCLYPPSTNQQIQRLKISACPDCNDSWQDDEAHFRNIITVAGPIPSQGRLELWETVLKTIQNPRGRRELHDLSAALAPLSCGRGQQLVYPGKDPRILRVVQKVVRGLCHTCDCRNIIADDRVQAQIMLYNIPPGIEPELMRIYEVPDIFLGRGTFFADTEFARELHSAWLLKFFEVEFIAIVGA